MKRYRKLYAGGPLDDPGNPITDTTTLLKQRGRYPLPKRDTTLPFRVTSVGVDKYMPMRAATPGVPVTSLKPAPGDTPAAGIRKPGILSQIFSASNINRVGKAVEGATPFMSNIYNAFQRAPRPNAPILDGFTNLRHINLDNERSMVRRTTDAANKATERNVDSNTAEAIKAFNRGQEFERINTINERETNTNVSISNAQAGMDAQVKGMNTERLNDYQTAKTAADIADVRERSANVANAGDKVVLIGNEKRKAKVEADKVRVLSSLFSKSGVLKRQAREWQKMGIPDPLGQNYSYAETDEEYNARTKEDNKKMYGGLLSGIPSRKLN